MTTRKKQEAREQKHWNCDRRSSDEPPHRRESSHGEWRRWLGERFGLGDGERTTLLTPQIAFEPLPASVLFALGGSSWLLIVGAHYDVKTISRLIEAGENFSPSGRKLSLIGKAFEGGVVKGDNVVNQSFEESSLVVFGVN